MLDFQECNKSSVKTNTSSTWYRPWLIWGTSAAFVLFQFFLQLSSGVIVEDLMKEFAINALGAGILSSTYYYIYVLLQTPAGILVDRYGPRKLLAGGGLVCTLGCWLFAISTHLVWAEFGRLLMGAGSSFAFVSSLFLISRWFPAEKFALMVGIAETVGTFGTLMGNVFLASLLSTLGWRKCMLVAAGIALIITLLCWLIIRDKPATRKEDDLLTSDPHFLKYILLLIRNPKAWINGIYSGLQFSIVTVLVALWGIPFLVKAHAISITMATIISSFLFIGLAVGCPFIGIIYPRIKNRRLFLIICALLNALCLIGILLGTKLSIISIIILMFVSGLLCSSYVLNFAIAKELVPLEATSTSIGFTNMLSVITAPIIQPAVGALLNLTHRLLTNSEGIAQSYTILDFQISLAILPLCLILAAILARALDK